MNLPLVNVFDVPYEVWESRDLSPAEIISRQEDAKINGVRVN